jgi:hypothetical protein
MNQNYYPANYYGNYDSEQFAKSMKYKAKLINNVINDIIMYILISTAFELFLIYNIYNYTKYNPILIFFIVSVLVTSIVLFIINRYIHLKIDILELSIKYSIIKLIPFTIFYLCYKFI